MNDQPRRRRSGVKVDLERNGLEEGCSAPVPGLSCVVRAGRRPGLRGRRSGGGGRALQDNPRTPRAGPCLRRSGVS